MQAKIVEELLALPDAYPGFANIGKGSLYLMGCRSFDQFCSTLRSLIDPQKYCPFCHPEHSPSRPLAETGHWQLRENDFPRKTLQTALLIVPTWHMTDLAQLSSADWKEVGELVQLGIRGVPGGGLALRFGDPHYHAGTIEHLHFNIYSPTTEGEYRFPLSKTEAKRFEDYEEVLGYRHEFMSRGGVTWLLAAEISGVTS